ncbi:hypothetical protein [Polynucleobacter sp. AP-Ainpum-60-G11]|uniref:hypothetical protein n=1 Tax=Polynucleobacter sp. AP-Ainpum-60-G11 TaxID=2576926 RepID=UPI001BFE9EB4|nr:hypothetical protein [Polynucleobacter sp. AP-Ainpum-60-G11]QWE27016.1 hypothetical protein FD971_01630 [Polynucleobacter sp. AP-Ainpum-60-G11]
MIRKITAHYENGDVKFLGDSLNCGHDFLLKSNSKIQDAEYILFFDSRGISKSYETSLIKRIEEYLIQNKKKYLAIVRPLELTTWSTLVNFLRLNKVSAKNIITNMGFVDFTPKKYSVIWDVLRQAESILDGGAKCQTVEVGRSLSSSGQMITLHEIIYPSEFKIAVQNSLRDFNCYVFSTPEIKKDIQIERARPNIFYSSIRLTNKFNLSLKAIELIELPEFNEQFTYDAVHYTDAGNMKIFEIFLDYFKGKNNVK